MNRGRACVVLGLQGVAHFQQSNNDTQQTHNKVQIWAINDDWIAASVLNGCRGAVSIEGHDYVVLSNSTM
jgi:hypothetical protein